MASFMFPNAQCLARPQIYHLQVITSFPEVELHLQVGLSTGGR